MNWVDLAIVGVIALSAFRGFTTGLIRQIVWLIAIVLGIVLAGLLYDDLSANLDFVIDDETTRNLVAFAAIAGGVVIAGMVIGQVLKTTASLLMLGPVDSIGGAVLGLIRGVITVQFILIAMSVFPAQATVADAIGESTLAPYFLEDIPLTEFGLPSEFEDPLGQLEQWRRVAAALLPDGLGGGVPADAAGAAQAP